MSMGNAFRQGTLDITSAAKSFLEAFSDPAVGGADDVPFNAIIIQADSGNVGVVYIGDANVSTSLYAFRVEIPVTGIPGAPIVISLPDARMKPSQLWAVGSNDDQLHFGFHIY